MINSQTKMNACCYYPWDRQPGGVHVEGASTTFLAAPIHGLQEYGIVGTQYFLQSRGSTVHHWSLELTLACTLPTWTQSMYTMDTGGP
jgi:hypothetical protein